MSLPPFYVPCYQTYLRQHGVSDTRPAPYKPKPTKCPSCGSREYVEHRGQRVCAFCRSGT